MSPPRDFVVHLARGGRNATKILVEVERSYGAKSISRSQVNRIIALVKSGAETASMQGKNTGRSVRTLELIQAVEDALEHDKRQNIEELAKVVGTSCSTIQRILVDDLHLVKKCARWVPRLLTKEQKKKRLEISSDFVARCRVDPTFLESVITMDESAVSFHTPETKN